MINLNSPPGILPEIDDLYRSELSEEIKQLKIEVMAVRYRKSKLSKLHKQIRESKGLESAYIGRIDLIKIIEDLLTNKSSVTKAFQRYEVNNNKCADWAKDTIKYSADEQELTSALDMLAKNREVILMKKYLVLDINDILRPASYSAALTKLKKQLVIANRFQDKDNELNNKDIIIAAKETKIEELKQELVRNKSVDWEEQALTLRQQGISVKEIGARVNKGRTTVSNYLNSPSIKAQLLNRPIKA